MFKLIDKGNDFSKFTRSYSFDFPAGLVLFNDKNNFFIIIGTQPAGWHTNGCDCCSTYYDETWLTWHGYNRWELWEYQLQNAK